jgi:hypothetical protein
VSRDDDLPVDVHRFDLDDALLDGGLLPDDAPSASADVAALVQAAQAPPSPGELGGEDRIVAEMAAVLPDAAGVRDQGRTPLLARIARAKVATILAASVIGMGAAAAVATGDRPSRHARVIEAAGGSPTTVLEVTIATSEPAASATERTVEAAATNTMSAAARQTQTSAEPARGPDASGPAAFGLCTAWHNDRATGNKLNAPPFVNLAVAANSAGKSIAAYCDKVFAEHQKPPGPGNGQGNGNGNGQGNGNGNGQGNGKAKGHGNGQGNGRGNGG